MIFHNFILLRFVTVSCNPNSHTLKQSLISISLIPVLFIHLIPKYSYKNGIFQVEKSSLILPGTTVGYFLEIFQHDLFWSMFFTFLNAYMYQSDNIKNYDTINCSFVDKEQFFKNSYFYQIVSFLYVYQQCFHEKV